MSLLAKALLVLSTPIVGTLATLPTSYDVAWTRPGVNGSADSMPLGGGDIGINTWFEDGKLLSSLTLKIQTCGKPALAATFQLIPPFLQRLSRTKLQVVVYSV